MTGYRFLTNAARFALVSMVVVGQLGALATAGVRAADVRLEDIPGDSLRDVRAPTAETYWTTELVDPGATVGAFSSLAIDSLDQLHVAYYDGDSLRYALLSSTWATTTIDTGGNVGMYASLALDGVEPHVAYYDVTNTALRHVYYETGLGWGPSEEVDNTADVGAYSALAIDRTYHYILISYYDATNQSLKLARFDSSWSSETVDAAIGSGLHTIAMATRRAPDVRIVYHDATNDRLEYAIGISDPPYWDFSEGPVNHGGEGGYFAALALDTGGDPHVSYFSADDKLVYAHHDGNMWTNTVIDSVWSEASINTAIALDADNQPHIAYTDDESAGRLTYAYLDGSTWMTQTVESSGVEGYPSIAIDADGFPHITYWTDSGLKHAWLRATSDLVVTDIWSGSSNQIWYQVQNVGQGTAPAGHQVALTIDSVASGTSTVPVDLAPGERYAAVIATVACSGSNDALRVTADNGGVVVESNETNNMRYELWDCDTTAPQITTGPQATGVTTNSAVIEWVTNENSDSWVYYDPSHLDYTTYEFEDGVYVTSHAIALTGLSPATVYRYAVESNDQAGNRVSSGEFFFETLPLPSPTLTGTLSIERGSRDYPTYAITAVISDAARALDPSIVDYASFYLNDTLVGRSYSAIRAGVGRTAYSYVLSPYQLGHSRGTFLGATHAVDVVVSVANGVDLELNDDLFPPWEEKPVEVNIWTPFNNAVYYTDGSDDLPPGTTIQLAAEAMEYEWECEWVSFRGSDPYAMPPDCGEVAQKSGPVEFYIDGAWIDTLSTPVAGTFVYVVQWDAGGLEVGPHTLTVITRDSEDIMNLASATRQFYVEEPTVGLGVERTVTRHGNYYEVELDISLSANSTNPITLDYLTDYADEFMPVQKETASYDVYFDYPAWAGSGERRAKITIDFTGGGIELEPGDSCQVSYQVVPILYEDGVADPIIGTLDVRLYYDGGDSFEVFDLSWQSLSSVQSALGTSDYIIVTNPDRLHDLYVESEVHDLLGTMAHLAVARNGVLGFLEGYVGVYADPDNDVLRDLTDGGYWADALHPNFQDSLEGYMLIVGETEIVPAFDSHNYDICWGIPDDSTHCEVRDNDVYHHDQWYSNTAGNGKPELIVGRIIGDSAWQLERPLIVSIGIAEGNFGHYYVADRALLASGGGDGVSYFEDNVDTIDMILDNVSDPSDDRWIVEVLNLAGESYPNLLVNSGIAEQISLMHLMGHGNVDSWAGALSTNDPPDLYGYMPFVFAPSCLTGNYEAGDDYNLAESLFDQGISGYVGSTQISPIQTNDEVSVHFYVKWDWEDGESLARAFAQTERAFYDDWSYYDWYRFWVVEYNYYGDPKFGASSSAPAARAAMATAAAPTTTLTVQVPDYTITTTVDGFDQVEIPGGKMFREGGMHEVPFWTVSLDYAPGYRVQDVSLDLRGGYTFTTGLELPTAVMTYYTDAPASAGYTETLNPTEDDDWLPALDRIYDWDVSLNPDGSSELTIDIFPFHYQPATTNVEWHNTFTFTIDVISTTVQIDGFELDAGTYDPGDEVLGDLWFSVGGDAQDLYFAATVRNLVTDEVVEGLPLDAFHDAIGNSYYGIAWDSTGIAPGEYLLWIDLFDSQGHLLDSASEMFRLGAPFAEITAFSATPGLFQPGDPVDVSMTIANAGSVAVSGEAIVQIYPTGVSTPTAIFTQTVTDLAPAGTLVMDVEWDTTGVTQEQYRVIGYLKYDARATEVETAIVSTQAYIYLPLVLRQ